MYNLTVQISIHLPSQYNADLNLPIYIPFILQEYWAILQNNFCKFVADFASEIADHTLEQVPNALYQGKRKLRRKTFPSRQQHNGGTDSTDSEELDHSDSGYSSPMHRQNQISSGTDAQTKTVDSHSSGVSVGAVTTATHYVTTPPLSVVTVSQVNSCTQLRQASSVYHAAPLYSEHINPNLRKSYALSASLHRPAIVTVPHLHTKMPQTTGSLAQTKDSALSEQEDELEEAHPSGKKRKRKRGRRRRRKGMRCGQ